MASSPSKREPFPGEGGTASAPTTGAPQQQQPHSQPQQKPRQVLQQQRSSLSSPTSPPQRPSLQQPLQPSTPASTQAQREEQFFVVRTLQQESRTCLQEQRVEGQQIQCGKNTEPVSVQKRGGGDSSSAAPPAHPSEDGHTQSALAPSAERSREISSSHRSLGSNSSSCNTVGHGSGRSSCRGSNASTSTSSSTSKNSGSSGSRNSGSSSSSRNSGSSSSSTKSSITGDRDGSRFSGCREKLELSHRSSARECAESSRTSGVCSAHCSGDSCKSGHTSACSCSSQEGSNSCAGLSSGTQDSSTISRDSHSSQSSSRQCNNDRKSCCRVATGDELGSKNRSADAGVSEAKGLPAVRKALARRSKTEQSCSTSTGEQPQAAGGAAARATGMKGFHFKVQHSSTSSSKNVEAQEASITSADKREGDRAGAPSAEEEIARTAVRGITAVDSSGTHEAKLRFAKSDRTGSQLGGIRAESATKAAAESRFLQHGKEAKEVVQPPGQQQQRPHGLTLHSVGPAISSYFSPRGERSSGGAGKPGALAGSDAQGHSPSVRGGSYCAATGSPAAAPLREHKRGLFLPLGGAAAVGAKTAAKDAEPAGGLPTRDAARLAAESLIWKIKKHDRPRSASHQPLSARGSSQQGDALKSVIEEHRMTQRGSLSSHWLWQEFFWHALHYSNKGATALRNRAAQTAAAAARSIGHHFGAGEGDGLDTSPEQGRTTAAGAHEEQGSPGSRVPPGAAHGASARHSAGAPSHLLSYAEKNRRAETPCCTASGAAAGRSAGEQHAGGGPHVTGAATHSVASAILQSAVHAVKSLPYRLRKDWMGFLRARKNSAHLNHTQRVQRAAEVQQEAPFAALATAQGDGSAPRCSAAAVSATKAGDEQGATAAPPGSGSVATLQPQRYVEGMPAVAGRFYPKGQKERAQELQAMLHMRQVLPSKETRARLLQHVQRNINKGRRDFEQAAPLLSLKREQLVPCGSTFVVRCLQQDSTAVAHIHRKYLTAGRLIGGGSEAMVFAAVEVPPPQPAPLYSPITNLVEWGRAAAEEASRSISGIRSSRLTGIAAARAAAGLRKANADSSSRASAGGTSRAAATSRTGHECTVAAGGGANAGGPDRSQEPVADKGRHPLSGVTSRVQQQQQNTFGVKHEPPRRGRTDELQSGEGEKVGQCSTRLARATPAAGTTGGAGCSQETAAAGRGGGWRAGSTDDTGQGGGTLSSSRNIAHPEWGRCWALKWFLCEPFLLYNRSKAEQEGTVVDWLQMALWRLVPLNSINAEVVDKLGIAAPHWIGFIEGLSLVSPGDGHFSLLNRVAAMPLMLGDLLTVPPVGLTMSDRLYCIMRLIQVIANMHAMGVLHNDIKLENILIGTDGTLHLGDLGTVTPFTGRPTRFQRIGTDVYLDPQTAQNFLEYERRLCSAQDQQLLFSQKRSKSRAGGNTRLEEGRGTDEAAAALEQTPEAGTTARAAATTGRPAASREGAAGEVGKARAAAVDEEAEPRGGGRTTTAGVTSKWPGDGGGGTDAGRGESQALDRDSVQTHQEETSQRPFRIVYTPMRDAWAAGVVCYYIWCGGLLPYNLHRAFGGEITGLDLFRFLARLPSSQGGDRLLFPLGSCPDGEAQELLEVRRIIQGLLEPDGALRKTPLEIVQESPLFSAYRADSFNREEETER